MRPFVLSSYEIKRKEILAKTESGKIYSFKIYPKEETVQENYYTKFIPEKKEFAIFSVDFEKIKSGNVNKEIEIKLVHELTHYDERVISPAYVFGRMKIPKQLEKCGFDIIRRFDNYFEDILSQIVMRKFFTEREIDSTINFKKDLMSRGNFVFEYAWRNLFSLIKIYPTLFLINFVITTLRKALDRLDFSSKSPLQLEERLKRIFIAYTIMDYLFILAEQNSWKNVLKFFRILISTKNILKKDSFEIVYKEVLEDIREYHNSLNTPQYIINKIREEIDPFWKLRWRLELCRLTNPDKIMNCWKKSCFLDFLKSMKNGLLD